MPSNKPFVLTLTEETIRDEETGKRSGIKRQLFRGDKLLCEVFIAREFEFDEVDICSVMNNTILSTFHAPERLKNFQESSKASTKSGKFFKLFGNKWFGFFNFG
jgi:hypothetical protein